MCWTVCVLYVDVLVCMCVRVCGVCGACGACVCIVC